MDWKTVAALEADYRRAEKALLAAVAAWQRELSGPPRVPGVERRNSKAKAPVTPRVKPDGTTPTRTPTGTGTLKDTVLKALTREMSVDEVAKATGLGRRQAADALKKATRGRLVRRTRPGHFAPRK